MRVVQTASIRVAVLGGSSAETLDEKGSAQLLASSAFDGNKNKSGLLTMREFEDIGAKVAATSDREKVWSDEFITTCASSFDVIYIFMYLDCVQCSCSQ